MRYQVPQFIEVEDKIFGPLTIKQFLYIGAGAGISFILYRLLGFLFAAVPILVICGFFLALAFYRPNDKPMINMLEAAFNYSLGKKLYIWKKTTAKPITEKATDDTEGSNDSNLYVPKLSDSKLRDLTWSLDVNESMYAGIKNKDTQK